MRREQVVNMDNWETRDKRYICGLLYYVVCVAKMRRYKLCLLSVDVLKWMCEKYVLVDAKINT